MPASATNVVEDKEDKGKKPQILISRPSNPHLLSRSRVLMMRIYHHQRNQGV